MKDLALLLQHRGDWAPPNALFRRTMERSDLVYVYAQVPERLTCGTDTSATSVVRTAQNPPISEAGRHYLAELLIQLTDGQLHDMFDAARVDLRPGDPASGRSGFATIDEWVDAFKQKREQIVARHCR